MAQNGGFRPSRAPHPGTQIQASPSPRCSTRSASNQASPPHIALLHLHALHAHTKHPCGECICQQALVSAFALACRYPHHLSTLIAHSCLPHLLLAHSPLAWIPRHLALVHFRALPLCRATQAQASPQQVTHFQGSVFHLRHAAPVVPPPHTAWSCTVNKTFPHINCFQPLRGFLFNQALPSTRKWRCVLTSHHHSAISTSLNPLLPIAPNHPRSATSLPVPRWPKGQSLHLFHL